MKALSDQESAEVETLLRQRLAELADRAPSTVHMPDEISVVAANLKTTPSRPFRITLDFLDATGQPVATHTQDIPAISPRQSQEFDVKVTGRGIAGWRYRAS